MSNQLGVIILAAGLGKRMHSALPKVLHEIGGQPLVFHILDRVLEAAPKANLAIVVGHDREKVEQAIRSNPKYSELSMTFVYQSEQKGTGHAARFAVESHWGEDRLKAKQQILILPGDLPLISRPLIEQMIAPLSRSEAMRLLTTLLPNPSGYGRVVRRGKKGALIRIVEERDANQREKTIKEVGASIYLFQSSYLKIALQKISNKNSQKEYYLTDVVSNAVSAKKKINVLVWDHHEDLRGVNDPWELSQAREILNQRFMHQWAVRGVKFISPATTWVDVNVELAADVTVYPNVILSGKTKIDRKVTLGPSCVLKDVEVGEGATIKTGTVAEEVKIGANSTIGPYANLRPDTVIGKNVKIGNFVELKKSKIGDGTSIAHLSYLGDAEVGTGVNIGCGFVTCNFDGRIIDGERKHKTKIEDNVFLGSDCQTVAPVKIGKGAFIASGSTITEDVEADALAIARAPQVNKPGYAKKLRQSGK